jgi:membrane protease YdiL (CAAX protease family)
MRLVNAALSAAVNVIVLAGLPLLAYVLFHKLRHGRGFAESAKRAGLQLGDRRSLAIAAVAALVVVAAVAVFPPPLEAMLQEGSPQRAFEGLGASGTALAMALLYGVVQTGFSEELLFRGLIAGSLGRRLPLLWANVVQAGIFLLPHLLVLRADPGLWPILFVVAAGALLSGWLRIRSGSILGPWLMHAAANVATCLSVAIRSAA